MNTPMPRYIPQCLDEHWSVYDTQDQKRVMSCYDMAEATRYANGYNIGLTDREIVEEYAKVP